MHELSIAVEIVSSIEEELKSYPGASVASVKVRIGALSGVVPDSLSFVWDSATDGTSLDGSRLDIETVAAKAWCENCQSERILETLYCFQCPICGQPISRVTAGKEMEIISAEILEPEPGDAVDEPV